jgi:hypothetical protein
MEFTFKGHEIELCRLLHCLCQKERKLVRRATFKFGGISFSATGDKIMLIVKDTDVPGKVNVSISFTDSKGKPAKVDGAPTWAADNAAVVDSVTPTADGLSADLHITDTPGACNITVSADVDLGSGTNSHDFVDTVSVIAGDATAATFAFGAVTPDSAPPAP